MHDTWVTSDQHYRHAKILTFKGNDGNLIRPGFSCVEEMDEVMIERWNARVKPNDKVYMLGDLGFGYGSKGEEAMDETMPRLNGRKVLIPGNHDGLDVLAYRRHFYKVVPCRVGHDLEPWKMPFVMCHFPWHPMSLGYGHKWCIHGHIHEKDVMLNGAPDPRYLNVSVEKNDYYPFHMDELVARMNASS